MADLPIACTLPPDDFQRRRQVVLPTLLARADAHDALPDGYRLRFTARDDVLALIAETIEVERRCCRFLRFVVTVEPDEGPIVLDVTGPPGTREFLDSLVTPHPSTQS